MSTEDQPRATLDCFARGKWQRFHNFEPVADPRGPTLLAIGEAESYHLKEDLSMLVDFTRIKTEHELIAWMQLWGPVSLKEPYSYFYCPPLPVFASPAQWFTPKPIKQIAVSIPATLELVQHLSALRRAADGILNKDSITLRQAAWFWEDGRIVSEYDEEFDDETQDFYLVAKELDPQTLAMNRRLRAGVRLVDVPESFISEQLRVSFGLGNTVQASSAVSHDETLILEAACKSVETALNVGLSAMSVQVEWTAGGFRSRIRIQSPLDAMFLTLHNTLTKVQTMRICPHPECGKLYPVTRKNRQSCGADKCVKYVQRLKKGGSTWA